MKISFITKGEEAKTQLDRLLILSYFDSPQKKLSILYKTLSLFKIPQYDKCLSYYLNTYNLSSDTQTQKYINDNKSDKLKYENFYFVQKEINDSDLEYQTNCFLSKIEVQYYLFRLSLKLIENHGSKKLSRNYFMSLKDSYYSNTGKKINKNKIAYMNKLLQKYDYIHVANNCLLFTVGKNHPLYHTSAVSDSNRSKAINNTTTVTMSEKYQNLKQDYDNLVLQYQCLQKQYESLERRYNNFFKPCLN